MMHRAVCPWGYGYDKSMDLLLFFSMQTSFLNNELSRCLVP